jgi:tRNA-dihydrouridine synthase B
MGNGGVRTAEDAGRMLDETGVDGVMAGRGAIGNPWLFRDIRRALEGLPPLPRSAEEHRAVILGHLDGLIRLKEGERKHRPPRSLPAEPAGVLKFRAILLRYLAGLPGGAEARRHLDGLCTREEVVRLVDRVLFERREHGQG